MTTSLMKLLNIGESSTGKTGALVSLLRAGYNVFALDYDNGLDIIDNILRDDGDPPAVAARLHRRSFRDRVTIKGGLPMVATPVTAYKGAGPAMEKWVTDHGDFTPNDVIVLDTLTTFSEAAFRQALVISGRLNQRPQLQDYGWMADSVRLFIEMLTDPGDPEADPPIPPPLNCHVIINTHIRYLGGEEEQMTKAKDDAFSSVRGLPNAKGQELSRVISLYFNSVILTRTMGSGPGARRVLTTQPQGVIEVKTAALKVKPTYPIDVGLAQLFQDILGHGGPSTSNIPTTQKVSHPNG